MTSQLCLLLLVICLRCTNGVEDERACSLPLSREAAIILSERLHNEAHVDAAMRPACPLQLEASRFGLALQLHALHRDGLHHCGACGAALASLDEADRHVVRSHPEHIHADGHCLAAHCDILACPSWPRVSECTPESIVALKRRCLHLVHQCFDGDSPAAHAAFDAASAALCEPLRCVDGVRVLSPPPPPPTSSLWAALLHWLKLLLVGGFVLAFYAFFYCYRREASIKDDLTRLAVQRRHLQAKLFEKEKLKGY